MARILLSLLMFCCLSLHAQNVITRDIPTPNASDLGKYGEVPVSYFTGQPNISIPLNTYYFKGYPLSIYLQYDACGVLVNSLPGWTGHNWTLIAGGSITRIQKNVPDEWKQQKRTKYGEFHNYFENPNRINEGDPVSDVTFSDDFKTYDLEPDVFVFNFQGKTGKFIYGNDGQWKVISEDNIDVLFDVKDESNYISPFIPNYPCKSSVKAVPKCIKGFTLRDDKGYVYIFGGDNSCIDYGINFFSQVQDNQNDSFIAKTWYLTKIKDKYGNTVFRFNYERGPFIAQFINSYNSLLTNDNAEYGGLMGTMFASSLESNAIFPYGGMLNSPVYLKSIGSGESGTLATFESSYIPLTTDELYPNLNLNNHPVCQAPANSGLELFMYLCYNGYGSKYSQFRYGGPYTIKDKTILKYTRLKVLDKIKFPTYSIELKYNYNNRMHLDEVKIIDGKESMSYQMVYNNFHHLPNDYLSQASDHWGYYNGMNSNSYNNFNKEVNDCSSNGQLTTLYYPTGGYTTFLFEHNTYGAYCDNYTNHLIEPAAKKTFTGGLRIKEICDFDGMNKSPVRKRVFSYNIPGSERSSGQLCALPLYSFRASTSTSFSKNTSVVPLSNTFGPHVGYSYVTVTEADHSSNCYHYSNISDYPNIMPGRTWGSTPPTRTDHSYLYGKILDESTYSSDGKLIEKAVYSYTKNPIIDKIQTTDLIWNKPNSYVTPFYTGSIYYYDIPKFNLLAKETTTYIGSHQQTNTDNYEYTLKSLPLSLPYSHRSWINVISGHAKSRLGKTQRTVYEYPFDDYRASATAYQTTKYFNLSPIGTKNYYNSTLINGEQTIYKMINDSVSVPSMKIRINRDLSVDTIETYLAYSKKFYEVSAYKPYNKSITKTGVSWGGYPEYVGYQEANCDNPRKSESWYYWTNSGKLTDVLYPNGNFMTYYYDIFDRLIEATDVFGNITQRIKYHTRKNEK